MGDLGHVVFAGAAHYQRDVSRWQTWSYGAGEQSSTVSGSVLTNPDTVGQVPSASPPGISLRLGRAGTTAFKGYLAQVIPYRRVLTPAENASLGAWAASIYGVAP